jgi:SAM-dependent methyltransferase
MIAGKDILNRAHGALVFGRRVEILAANLAKEIPIRAEVLDVGTGDGSIAKAIALHRPDIKIEGIDVLIRPSTHIPVRLFDGEHIPLSGKTVDVVSFVDVLHHTSNARILLREAARVSRRYIVIKDHLREGPFAKVTLQAMDWIGNYGTTSYCRTTIYQNKSGMNSFETRISVLNAGRKVWDYTHFRSRWSLADAFTLSHV